MAFNLKVIMKNKKELPMIHDELIYYKYAIIYYLQQSDPNRNIIDSFISKVKDENLHYPRKITYYYNVMNEYRKIFGLHQPRKRPKSSDRLASSDNKFMITSKVIWRR